MSFLGRQEIENRLDDLILKNKRNNIEGNKYELSLGMKYSTSDGNHIVGNAYNGQVVINPGQFCFLETEEYIMMPSKLMGFISIKASAKFKGLVNVSGFHVDPDFRGKIVFSVLNAGPSSINLTVGDPLFQIWFAELKSESEGYSGQFNEQHGVTSKLINQHMSGKPIASPAELTEKLVDLNSQNRSLTSSINQMRWVIGIIAVLVIPIFIKTYIENINSSKTSLKSELKNEILLEILDSRLK